MQGVHFPAPLISLLDQKYLSKRESMQSFSFTQDDQKAQRVPLKQPASRVGQEEGSSGKIWGSSEKLIP